MNERSKIWVQSGIIVGLGALFTFGCNGILGSYEVDDTIGVVADDGGQTSIVDAAIVSDASGSCAPGEKECAGACVKANDPVHGCSSTSCDACPSGAFVKGTECAADGACAVSCEGTRQNCDKQAANGCEVDTQWDPKNCGTCGNVCAAGTFCSKGECKGNCDPGLSKCVEAQACVDIANDPTHCGVPGDGGLGCGVPCPAGDNATPTCKAGVCGLKCNANYALCGGACKPTNQPTSCGPSCTDCGTRDNAAASCGAGACAYTCRAGFDDCSAEPNKVNGCACNLGRRGEGPHLCNAGACCAKPNEACGGKEPGCCAGSCVAGKCELCGGLGAVCSKAAPCCDGFACNSTTFKCAKKIAF